MPSFRQWLESRATGDIDLRPYRERDDEAGRTARALLDASDRDREHFLGMYRRAIERAAKLINAPMVDWGPAVESFLSRAELPRDESDLFPVTVYVSAGDDMTVGLLVHEDGRIELFEGNEDASDETYDLVNGLVEGEPVRLYGSHDEDVVAAVRETGKLPAGLFLSPNKQYAAGYWGRRRVLFSVEGDSADFRQESELDWRSMPGARVTKFRYE